MKRLAVFASGSGTNFEAIAQACADGRIDAQVVLLVCDNPKAGVLDRADRLGVPTFTFVPKTYYDKSEYEGQILQRLQAANIDLICLAGYMRIIGPTLLEAFPMRIINLHPALLPSFPGAHGIADAYNYGVKVFGITIHFVDEGVDTGKIINQFAFHAEPDDTLETVETKIHQLEHKYFPVVINDVICDL
jgi:phosphoribosylglycinamide formyltransferase-1